MEKEKLTIEHLAPYLPYGLKLIDHLGNKCNISYLSTKRIAFIDTKGYGDIQKLNWGYASGSVKPILHPLSDLTKEIEIDGKKFVPYDKAKSVVNNDQWIKICSIADNKDFQKICDMPYWWVNLLFEWHFDVFGLIEKGLAININTL